MTDNILRPLFVEVFGEDAVRKPPPDPGPIPLDDWKLISAGVKDPEILQLIASAWTTGCATGIGRCQQQLWDMTAPERVPRVVPKMELRRCQNPLCGIEFPAEPDVETECHLCLSTDSVRVEDEL